MIHFVMDVIMPLQSMAHCTDVQPCTVRRKGFTAVSSASLGPKTPNFGGRKAFPGKKGAVRNEMSV